jgi:hypothetical protein
MWHLLDLHLHGVPFLFLQFNPALPMSFSDVTLTYPFVQESKMFKCDECPKEFEKKRCSSLTQVPKTHTVPSISTKRTINGQTSSLLVIPVKSHSVEGLICRDTIGRFPVNFKVAFCK